MPFNGSGTYTLPAGNPVTTGTAISSVTHNATNSDIATALTNCITRDGQSTPSANLPMGGRKLTGLAAGTSAGDSVRYEQVAKINESTGVNNDIKAITGLTTPLAVSQGGTGVNTSTGSGSNVLSNSPTINSPTLVTPALGTPASGNLSNCSGDLSNCTFPTLNQNTTGTANRANGLTGGTAYNIVYQISASATGYLSSGSTGQILQSNGSASAPSWITPQFLLLSGGDLTGLTTLTATNTAVNTDKYSFQVSFVDNSNGGSTVKKFAGIRADVSTLDNGAHSINDLYGGYFVANCQIVATPKNGSLYGVYGEATASTGGGVTVIGSTFGLYGKALSIDPSGIEKSYGVYAYGGDYGLYSKANDPNKYAIFSGVGKVRLLSQSSAGALELSSVANFGVFFGLGSPNGSVSAAKGSLYLRTDGSGTNDRMYVNTNGGSAWTAVVTVA